MQRSLKELEGYKISAKDDEIGKVDNFYFDDNEWVVRYLVINTGGWLLGRKVLISPHSFGTPNLDEETIPVNLTKKQVEDSPPIEEDKPVSRQHEHDLIMYYNWPAYWVGGAGGQIPTPIPPPIASKTEEELSEMEREKEDKFDPNLRSCNDVLGYNIEATDGSIGHIEDFIYDEENWKIRYAVVDTKNWLPGKKVIIAIPWIDKIDWLENKVYVNHAKDEIENSPEVDLDKPIPRDYEDKLYQHYSRERYWKEK